MFIKNEITYIRGSKPNKNKKKTKKQKKKQAKLYKGVQAFGAEVGVEGEEGERTSAGVFGSPEQSVEKDSSAFSSLVISKLRSKPG